MLQIRPFFPHGLLNISSVLHNSQSQKQQSAVVFYSVSKQDDPLRSLFQSAKCV